MVAGGKGCSSNNAAAAANVSNISGGTFVGGADGSQLMLHATTAAFGLNVSGGAGGVSFSGNGGSSAGIMDGGAATHFADGLLNMRVVSLEALHDLVDLEDLQHANTFVTYVQHSAVVEQLNGGRGADGCKNKRQRRQQLLKIPNRMTELLSRVTANLNCYNNGQRHSRQQQQQAAVEEIRVLPASSPQQPQQEQ